MSLKTAKRKAWQAFSRYIRLRDSDGKGYCKCISCGTRRFWEGDGMQAGHLIPSRSNSILFDEALVYSQCSLCNYSDGEQARFWLALKKKHGYTDEKFEEFRQRKHQTKKYSISDLKEIEEEYTDKANGLLIQKGLL